MTPHVLQSVIRSQPQPSSCATTSVVILEASHLVVFGSCPRWSTGNRLCDSTTGNAFQIIETQLPPFFLAYAGVKSVSRAANWEFSIGSGLEDWEQASGV